MVAAPPMSFFMLSMPAAGLRSSPPVSKHTPLPTSVTLGSLSLPQVRSISRGARTLARPTAWIIGKFCFRRSSPTITLIRALCVLASACEADRLDDRCGARLVGVLGPDDLRTGLALLRLVAFEAPRPQANRDGSIG